MARAAPARDFFEEGALIRRSDVRFSVPMIAAMAIYHLHVKVIGRKAGSSAVASAAYRSGLRLRDERLDHAHDFTAKRGVVHSEVMLPEGAPDIWTDRERLWNDVEAFEVRKDAQLAREVEFSIPREMSEAQGIELARDFVQSEFVDQGMIADLNVHWDIGEDGSPKPHAHVMLTMRKAIIDGDEIGFGPKVRDWNRTEMVEHWRERWADHVNERLAELDIDARIDHRSLEAQGIDLEPQSQIGAPAQRIEREGIETGRAGDGIEAADTVAGRADRAELHREIARNNGERIIADPSIALDAITHQQSTFTRRDMAMFAHRHSDGIEQFNAVMGAIGNAPELVELGKDSFGNDRFTTRDMIEVEQRLHRAAELMAEKERHAVSDRERDAALSRAEANGLKLSGEQAEALVHVTDGRDLGIVVGYAGTGKSAMLGVAREVWEAEGYAVRGVALSGIAAENLESGSGISSRTIASMEHGWKQGRDTLTSRDVLVIDEAGMVGTRQMERVLSHAQEVGAKVVLAGDPQQLQSIEAGAAFRSIHERHGGVEISEVRRQREDWQRDATRDLATGNMGEAIHAYERNDMVHAAETREQARNDLIEGWDRQRQENPDASRIILTHTNVEVRELNEAARAKVRDAGNLGEDVCITVETRDGQAGERSFAAGDRVMFMANERGLGGDGGGVKNGTLGTIEEVSTKTMTVRTDDGRHVSFDLKDYNRIDHGYAATIHKAQGLTVDRTHVLATPGLDAHGSYVALSRHREGMELHYGQDDFASRDKLINTLSRDRSRDMASDYGAPDYDQDRDPVQTYAERRGLVATERTYIIEMDHRPEPNGPRIHISHSLVGHRHDKPDRDNAGLGAGTGAGMDARQEAAVPDRDRDIAEDPEAVLRRARTEALRRHARAVDAIFSADDAGRRASPQQWKELTEARKAFDQVRPHGWQDAEAAYGKDADLAREAGTGRVNRAIRALQLETEIRTSPERRADRFVERWQKLDHASQRQYQAGDMSGYRASRAAMGEMAKSLERDPQLESLLANRKHDLGIGDAFEGGRSPGQALAVHHGLGRGRGLGL
ncbi:hypothetical protein At12D1_11550 [Agrobacterium tumefaciens]|nr:hypothetical protein At12D1_11550 [Agrobacterium tumefaciens]